MFWGVELSQLSTNPVALPQLVNSIFWQVRTNIYCSVSPQLKLFGLHENILPPQVMTEDFFLLLQKQFQTMLATWSLHPFKHIILEGIPLLRNCLLLFRSQVLPSMWYALMRSQVIFNHLLGKSISCPLKNDIMFLFLNMGKLSRS